MMTIEKEFFNLNKIILKKYNSFLDGFGTGTQVLISIAIASIVLIAFFSLSRLVIKNKKWFYKFAKTEILVDLISQSLALVFKLLGFIIVMYIFGAESIIGFVLGTAGVIGLGISFAFKDIIENYIAGILLSIKQPFRKKDHIKVADFEGIVYRMTTRMTMIKTFSGNNISIPNATIFKSAIINYSVIPERKFDFKIGIGADECPKAAIKAGVKALENVSGVMANPPPLGLIDGIGDSTIDLCFYAWVDQEKNDYFQTKSDAIGDVKAAIEKKGISIPDPSYVLKLVDNDVSSSVETIETENEEEILDHKPKLKEIIDLQINKEKHKDSLLFDNELE